VRGIVRVVIMVLYMYSNDVEWIGAGSEASQAIYLAEKLTSR
jgi:hypothetical protein